VTGVSSVITMSGSIAIADDEASCSPEEVAARSGSQTDWNRPSEQEKIACGCPRSHRQKQKAEQRGE